MSGAPCVMCGVRPDVACRHRPASEEWQPPKHANPAVDPYKPKRGDGAGLNFGKRTRIGGGGAYRHKLRPPK